jgi:hypothetical protein
MNRRIARNHEIPTVDSPEAPFVPRKARSADADEIAWRKEYAGTGALVSRQQIAGIDATGHILASIEDPHELGIASQMLGATMTSTARELLKADPRRASKMRQVVKYAKLADNEGWRETPEGFRTSVFASLDAADEKTRELLTLQMERQPTTKVSLETARAVGHAGYRLALFPLPRLSQQSSAHDIHEMMREEALRQDKKERDLAKKFGARPTLAMLVDDASPLAVEFRTSPIDSIAEAYEAAMAIYDPSANR